MSIEEDKIAKFVQRLWDNPSLAGLSPLQKEEQLHLFVDANAAILQPTMASAAFFPGLTWFQVKDLLERSISQLANNSLGALYEVIMEKRMDLSFVYTLNKKRCGAAQAKRADQSICEETRG